LFESGLRVLSCHLRRSSFCIMLPGAGQQTIDFSTPLKLENRPPATTGMKIFGGFFYGQLVLQVALVIACVATQNVAIPDLDNIAQNRGCPTGMTPARFSLLCLDNALKTEQDNCKPTPRKNSHGVMELATDPGPESMWDLLGRNAVVPSTVIPMGLLFCALWLFLLKIAPQYVIWGSIGLNVLFLLYAYYLVRNWAMLVVAALVVVFAIYYKKAVEVAIMSIKVAARALSENPVIFLVCAGIELLWGLYSAFFVYGMMQVGGSKAVATDGTCQLTLSLPANMLANIGTVLFTYNTMYFNNAALCACAVGVGSWYFPSCIQKTSITHPAAHGAIMAFTSSSGAVSEASIIMTIVEECKKRANNPRWFLNPISCLTKCLWCAIASCVDGLTRFALISHMFHGGGFRATATNVSTIIRNRLPAALMTATLSHKIFDQIATVLATAIGFFVWYWLDKRGDGGVFAALGGAADAIRKNTSPPSEHGGNTQQASGEQAMQYFILSLIGIMAAFVRKPVATILLLVLFNTWVSPQTMYDALPHKFQPILNSFFVAIFFAAMFSIIFHYFAQVVEYSTDVIFYCFALEAEMGKKQDRMVEIGLYDCIDNCKNEQEQGGLREPLTR
jgi:hypothetical protein